MLDSDMSDAHWCIKAFKEEVSMQYFPPFLDRIFLRLYRIFLQFQIEYARALSIVLLPVHIYSPQELSLLEISCVDPPDSSRKVSHFHLQNILDLDISPF